VAPETWSALAAIAGALSAMAAFTALCISAEQNSHAAAAFSLGSVQKFSDDCRTLFKECHECGEDTAKFERCLTDILGSFELFSIAVNESRLTLRTRAYIVETIADYLDKMCRAGYHDYVVEMTEKSHSCRELKLLFIQHQSLFENRTAVADMLNVPRSAVA
jgi:hypothetical protein